METNILHSFGRDSKFIDLPCPHCHKPVLKIIKDKFSVEQTLESKRTMKAEGDFPDFVEYLFSGILKCESCNEFVSVTGRGDIYEFNVSESESDYEDRFEPKVFIPPIPLFRIHKDCPTKVSEEIISAFNLFWLDYSACANKIRVALEQIMNDKRVKKLLHEKEMHLHDRIIAFGDKFPKYDYLVTYLLGSKVIGNKGSHAGGVNRQDVISGFELIEECVNQIYGKRSENLTRLSQAYNGKFKPKSLTNKGKQTKQIINLNEVLIDLDTVAKIHGFNHIQPYLKLSKGVTETREKKFLIQLSIFFGQTKEITQRQKDDFHKLVVKTSPKFYEKLVTQLEQIEDESNARTIGKLFTNLVTEKIDFTLFLRLSRVVIQSFYSDLEFFKKVFSDQQSITDYFLKHHYEKDKGDEQVFSFLLSNGLVFKPDRLTAMILLEEYKVTDFGVLLIEYGLK